MTLDILYQIPAIYSIEYTSDKRGILDKNRKKTVVVTINFYSYTRLITSEIPEKPPRSEPASGDLLREFQRLKQKPSDESSHTTTTTSGNSGPAPNNK